MQNNSTLVYYDNHADEFYKGTVNVEFTAVQEHFLSKLKNGAYILDFGCGSGRDAKYFLEQGYHVEAVDGSVELYGTFTGERNGRFFTDMTEETFAEFLGGIKDLEVEEQWTTSDARPGRGKEKWLNLILKKQAVH